MNVRKLFLGILAAGALTATGIISCTEPAYSKKEGVVRNGPYKGARYEITETKEERLINLDSRNDYIVPEVLRIRATDTGKDGTYESINIVLEGKDTSRNLGHIPTDLASILEQANSK